MGRWPVIDTSHTVGVGPMIHYFGEEELLPDMDKNGIDIQIIYQPDECFHHETPDWNPYLGNDYIAKVQLITPKRIWGLATLQVYHQPNPDYPYKVKRNIALEELDRAILELGLKGLRMNPIQHNFAFNDRLVCWTIMRRLTELQRETGRRMIVSVHASGDCLYNSPEALADTAREFPDLIFLMQHAGFVWGCFTVCDVAANVQNLFLDITTMPQKAVVYKAYERFGARKFCIGTDGPYSDNRLKMAIVDDFAENEEEKEIILGGNLAQVLRIPRIEGRS